MAKARHSPPAKRRASLRIESTTYEDNAHNGPTALRLAQEARPDVALLDIGLPGIGGYELGRRLRALPGLARLPLVAFTGYGRASDQQRSREAGFDAHLAKPVEPDFVVETVQALTRAVHMPQ